jgi:hypothetical protein
VECESKSDTSNIMGDWKHLKTIQTLPEEHIRQARNQGTIKSSHIGHCTHTAESANVQVHNIFQGRNNITCSTDCKYRTAATVYT